MSKEGKQKGGPFCSQLVRAANKNQVLVNFMLIIILLFQTLGLTVMKTYRLQYVHASIQSSPPSQNYYDLHLMSNDIDLKQC